MTGCPNRSERLHASFSVWLAEHGTGLVELDELTGHHLEQAARYRIGSDSPTLNWRAAPARGSPLPVGGLSGAAISKRPRICCAGHLS